MNKFKLIGVSLVTAAVLTGCAMAPFHSSTIIPLEDGTFDLVSTGETENFAYKEAKIDAKAKCQSMEKSFVSMSHKSVYQGVDKEKKQDVDATNVALAWVTGTSNKEDRSDDYKVTMKFKCV